MATLNVLASGFLLISTRLSGLGRCWVSRSIQRLWATATAASSRGCNCRDHFPPFPTSLVCRSFAFSFYIFFFSTSFIAGTRLYFTPGLLCIDTDSVASPHSEALLCPSVWIRSCISRCAATPHTGTTTEAPS